MDLYTMKHVIGLELHPPTRSSLNYMTIGGYNKSIVANPNEIMWESSYCTKHWEFFIYGFKFEDTMIAQDNTGLRARISVETKGIVVQQSLWPQIKSQLEYKISKLTCKDGDPKTKDFENMRSYCYYDGNCRSMPLESIFFTLRDGKELEIVKE